MNTQKTIGIVSPSAPISAYCPKRLERGIRELKNLGFSVVCGEHVSALTEFTAGSPEQRAADIHSMFAHPEVDIIIATIGGYNANDLLGLLDYSLIKKNNKKIFVGYSDISILLSALHKKAGVQCLLGPMVLPQFGEFGGILPFSKESFMHVISNLDSERNYLLPKSTESTEEFTAWDSEDIRPRVMESNQGWEIIQTGKASGHLVGGNLRSLLATAATEFFPNTENTILFLEDDNEENGATVCRMLRQLQLMGALESVKGVVFGRFQKGSKMSSDILKKIVSSISELDNVPIISNVDFGHTDPILTLPLGKKVEIDTEKSSISITL